MKRDVLVFNSVEEFCDKVLMVASVLSNDGIAIVGTYGELCPILNRIVKYSDYELYYVKFCSPEWNDYQEEYVLSIDDEKHVWVEPARRKKENGDFSPVFFDEIAFAYKDVGEDLLEANKDSIIYLFDITGESKLHNVSDHRFNIKDEVADKLKIKGKINHNDVTVCGDLFNDIYNLMRWYELLNL